MLSKSLWLLRGGACGWRTALLAPATPCGGRGRLYRVRCGVVAEFCEHQLGFTPADAAKAEVRLKERAQYVKAPDARNRCEALQVRLGLSEAQLRKVVVGLPSVLGFSYEANLEPKLAFLEAELELSLAALRDSVVSFPALLGYSLAKRFRPRYEACRAVGVDDLRIVLGRVAMPDARFYPSIGLQKWDEFL